MYYLGIDGGGTKTAFALMNEKGDIISTYDTSGCYYPKIGKEGVCRVLLDGISQCTKGVDLSKVTACAGLPAYGELVDLMRDLEEMQEKLPVPIHFVNDVEVGYYGALGFLPGINIVSGTGSIAVGFDEAGNTTRSGGFGSELGGDEGSAHYIGRRLIQSFTRQIDLREQRTLLYDVMREKLHLENDLYVMNYFLEDDNMEREKIAKFSVLAGELAMQGDPGCLKIFQEAAYELYLLAVGVRRQLSYQKTPIWVSYSGGVFKSGRLILDPLKKLLKEDQMEIVEPLHSPVYGACIKAKDVHRTTM